MTQFPIALKADADLAAEYPQPLDPTEMVSAGGGLDGAKFRPQGLEGGKDDRWFHDDLDGELDAAWHKAMLALMAKRKLEKVLNKHLPGKHDQASHAGKVIGNEDDIVGQQRAEQVMDASRDGTLSKLGFVPAKKGSFSKLVAGPYDDVEKLAGRLFNGRAGDKLPANKRYRWGGRMWLLDMHTGTEYVFGVYTPVHTMRGSGRADEYFVKFVRQARQKEKAIDKATAATASEAQLEAGNYKKKHLRFRGMEVSIENRAGSVREGKDKDGTPWRVKMHYDYGYIRRTEGTDGDHVDVYIGPDEDADTVYVVHQAYPETGRYDEDKCMLGFGSAEQAKAAYLKQYDDPKFFGAMTAVPISMFKEKVFGDKGEPVVPDAARRAAEAKLKSLIEAHLPGQHDQASHGHKGNGETAGDAQSYPVVGKEVDGRKVREGISNTDSISASLADYKVLRGIREVPMKDFPGAAPKDMFYSADDLARVKDLAERIKSSGEISPLIVVVDKDGPYVLEGAHRLAALYEIGAKAFPALVVEEAGAQYPEQKAGTAEGARKAWLLRRKRQLVDQMRAALQSRDAKALRRARLELAGLQRLAGAVAQAKHLAGKHDQKTHGYHTTASENLYDIAREGLLPHKPSFREEQDYWPKPVGGSGKEGRIYFGISGEAVEKFGGPGNMVLRVKWEDLSKIGVLEEFAGADYFTRKRIPPKFIEYQDENGDWKPIQSLLEEKHLPGQHDQQAHAGERSENKVIGQARDQNGINEHPVYEVKDWKSLPKGRLALLYDLKSGRLFAANRDVFHVDMILTAGVDWEKTVHLEYHPKSEQWDEKITVNILQTGATVRGREFQEDLDRAYKNIYKAFDALAGIGAPASLSTVIEGGLTLVKGTLKSLAKKHLPGQHDQTTHAGERAGAEVATGEQAGKQAEQSEFARTVKGAADPQAAWKALSPEEKDRLADAANSIHNRFQRESAEFGEADLNGSLDEVVSKRLVQIGDKMMPDAHALVAGHMKAMGQALAEAGVPEAQAKALLVRSTDALAIQEQESMGRQLGDHGARHLLGDAAMALEILKGHPGADSPQQTAAVYLASIFHDTGYTTEPGGTVGMDGRHPQWSKQYYDAQVGPAISEALGQDWAGKVGQMVETHADTNLDWKNDPVASALRVADNVALFHAEKLPGLYKYVPQNLKVLMDLGAKKMDVATARAAMAKNIAGAQVPDAVKQQLLRASQEVGQFSPKFTLGMLGGSVKKLQWQGNYLNIMVNRNRAAVRLQQHLDLGQRQFIKFAEAFLGEGAKEQMGAGGFVFGKPPLLKFTISGEVIKALTAELRLRMLLLKHLPNEHDQKTHGRHIHERVEDVDPRRAADYVKDAETISKSTYAKKLASYCRSIAGKSGVSRDISEAAYHLGYRIFKGQGNPTYDLAMAKYIEDKIGDRNAMLAVMGAQARWNVSPDNALKEWAGAYELGANTHKRIKELPKLSEKEVAAYRARTEFVQQYVKEKHGKEIELFRGVHGAQAKKISKAILDEGEAAIDFAQYGLASWTTDVYDTNFFAYGKNLRGQGAVITFKANYRDVFSIDEIGVRSPLRFSEDRGEFVLINPSNVRRILGDAIGLKNG